MDVFNVNRGVGRHLYWGCKVSVALHGSTESKGSHLSAAWADILGGRTQTQRSAQTLSWGLVLLPPMTIDP